MNFIRYFISIFLLTGCSLLPIEHYSKSKIDKNIQKLSAMISSLDKRVDRKEADDLATSSIYYALELAKEYRVVSPPLWHNTLVNIGLRERGLCYQWAEDMLLFFLKKRYKTLKFYFVGADIGDYFEHNGVVVSFGDFKDGIILDAWRNSGNLYFNYVKKDKYNWKNRENIYKEIENRLKI